MDDSQPEDLPSPQLYLVHDGSFEPDSIAGVAGDISLVPTPWSERETVPALARVLLFLGDEQIRDLAQLALERQWAIGVLPHPEAHRSMAATGVKGSLAQVFKHYLNAKAIEADALACNDELVFSSVVIGRVLALRPYDINRPATGWSLVKGALKGLGRLSLNSYKLTTGKEREIRMAALGLVAMNHTQSSLIGRSFSDDLGIADGRLAMLALAPRSVLSYLRFILRMLLPWKISLADLPGSLSLILTDSLRVEAPRGTEYLLDGKPIHGSEIELRILKDRLRLLPGPAMILREQAKAVDKETVRLNHIPVEEAAGPLLDKPLPLFNHATEAEYRDLFVGLRENAKASRSYQVLMVLSVLLALTGMYANSAPVIIGAMILAPLMSPIVSLAMGLARTETGLIRTSMQTLLIGVAWGMACAILLAWAMPLEIPTTEMKARMSPSLLDLLVAVISGIAGAYANAKEEIAKSLAGVAIAVALVPPLSVAGIGVGWGDWDMAGGAFLLLITNLVGISLAASATFLVLGFAPFKRAQAGLGISLLLVLLISAPLTISFSHLVKKDRIMENVPTGEIRLSGLDVSVGQVRVTVGDPTLVRVVLSSPTQLDQTQVDELKEIITSRVGEPILLEAQLNIRR